MPRKGKGITQYFIKPLYLADAPKLQSLLERCADYFQLVSGANPKPGDAELLLTQLPPGKTAEDKFVFGIHNEDGELIGVWEAVLDYPGAEDVWLGLLLLAPEYRRKGMGSELYLVFEAWAADFGMRQVYLGMVETNQAAYRFWLKQGFSLHEVRKQPNGPLAPLVYVLRRQVGRQIIAPHAG